MFSLTIGLYLNKLKLHLVVFALITTSLLIENYNLNGQFINEAIIRKYDNRADLNSSKYEYKRS